MVLWAQEFAMKTVFAFFIMIAPLNALLVTQKASLPGEADPPTVAVEITSGPVVESVTDTTAVIAWSTNVNAGTLLRYGTDPNHLDQTVGMPWGGLTHRVDLKDLKPDTRYYFKAESAQGQGTGTAATAPSSSFRTKMAATCFSKCA
jgi:phosphodiesterase/alkaline phosphatase D-like protein